MPIHHSEIICYKFGKCKCDIPNTAQKVAERIVWEQSSTLTLCSTSGSHTTYHD